MKKSKDHTAERAKIAKLFEDAGLPLPVAEHRFHPTRLWRFDYAWPAEKIALEVEGGIWTGGRHINPAGFIADLEKYNAAAVLGWRIIRLTPNSIETLISVHLVREAMKGGLEVRLATAHRDLETLRQDLAARDKQIAAWITDFSRVQEGRK